MGTLEKLERMRTRQLAAVFACSILLSCSFLVSIVYSWKHVFRLGPYENALRIGGIALVILMIVLLLWWRTAFRRSARKDSSLRIALKDERVKLSWLRAYRLAFFVILVVQISSKGPIMIWGWPWDVPYQSAFSLSAAIAAATGAFLFYSREARHE